MTIASFLSECQNSDETRLRITARGKGRVYDGTIKEFKTEDEYVVNKSKLAMDEIFCLSFGVITSNFDGKNISFEPLVIIVI